MAKDEELRDTLTAALAEYREATPDDVTDARAASAGDDLAWRLEAALVRGVDYRRVRDGSGRVQPDV